MNRSLDNMPCRKFFLMPIPPTPNGRLHLGHIAGPYLRMDMLGRYLRGKGHRVHVVSAIDGFDSYVLWKGLQENRPPQEVCRDYHIQIARDLASLDIDVDEFLDLVQGPYAERHAENARRVVQQLVDLGVTECVTEKVLYSKQTGRYIAGAWLLGRCPCCEAFAAGYFCEICGAHFRPESMLDPKPRVGDTELQWREVENLFLRVHDETELVRQILASGASERFVSVIRRFLEREQGRVRLTAPGDWGVQWQPDRWGNPRVLFEAGWEYALTCGDWYVENNADQCHPMLSNGDVTTLVSFGIDNSVQLLAGSSAILNASRQYKPFDHVLTNYFYNLQGAKFSTSRLHVIWAADIVEKTPARSDAVRYFLARESPEDETTNFDVEEFIRFANEDLAGTLQERINAACDALKQTSGEQLTVPPALRDRLEAASLALDRAFQLDAVSVRSACAVLWSWINFVDVDFSQAEQAYGWLKGVAYLANPVMPRLAAHLWQMLGHEDMPQWQHLFSASQPQVYDGLRAWFQPLSTELLRPSLPSTLLRSEVAYLA